LPKHEVAEFFKIISNTIKLSNRESIESVIIQLNGSTGSHVRRSRLEISSQDSQKFQELLSAIGKTERLEPPGVEIFSHLALVVVRAKN
jgi:hypothetical protein